MLGRVWRFFLRKVPVWMFETRHVRTQFPRVGRFVVKVSEPWNQLSVQAVAVKKEGWTDPKCRTSSVRRLRD